jgi:hypothetical protein
MRCLTRMGLGLVGLALVAPTATWADPPASNPPAGKKTRAKSSLFRKAHLCAQCQWSDLRAKGINVPPPPPMPRGGLMTSENVCDRCGSATGTYSVPPLVSPAAPAPPPVAARPMSGPGYTSAAPGGTGASGGTCVACEAAASGAPVTVAGATPGRAVAGGEVPGYAVISGSVPSSEPAPIGMVQGRYAYQNPAAAAAGPARPMAGGRPGPGPGATGPGSSDPSVMPSSYAADPYVPHGRSRPHIIQHLFGLDALGQRKRQENERRERENHAAISYQPQNATVTELPTDMVYGR